MPLKTQQPFGIKNKSKTLNRTFNKTHSNRIQQQKHEKTSDLFIKGKNV